MPGVVAQAGDYTVEIDTGQDVSSFLLDDPFRGILNNTAFFLGPSATTYADVTEWVTGVSYKRGRETPFDQFAAGTLTFTLNDTLAGGILNPYNAAYVVTTSGSPQPGLAPMRKVRVFREAVALFVGVIESYDYEYTLDRQNIVTVRCVDEFWKLANTFMDAYNPSPETSGQRINTILALPEVGYTGATAISPGTVNLGHDAAYDIAAGTNVLAYLQQINDTAEFGRFFAAADGTLTFQPRVGTTLNPPVVTFSDQPGTFARYNAVGIQFDARQVVNRAVVTGLDGTTYTAADAPSQALYFVQARDVGQSLLHQAAEIQAAADYLLDPEPAPRLTGVTLNFAMLTETQRDTVAAIDIGDTISIAVNVEGMSPIASDLTVEGITGQITPQGGHDLTFYTADVTVLYLLVLNDATFGRLDSTNALG